MEPTVMEPTEPTQFFTDAFVDVPRDEEPKMAMPGLDEWKVPETISRADGSCMSIWELARANGNYIPWFRTIELN